MFTVNMSMLTSNTSKFYMKNHYSIFFVLIFWILLTGCRQDKVVNQLQKEPYYDLKSLINEQTALLDSLNPAVNITAQIDEKKETIATHKDSASWESLLKLFNDADINQPVLQGSYIVKDSFDNQKGLQIKLYKASNTSTSNIPYLKVYYKDSLYHVKHIETVFKEENMLYSTQRKMSATFDTFRGNPRIVQYETLGKQKMIFRDSAFYKMQVTIDYSPES